MKKNLSGLWVVSIFLLSACQTREAGFISYLPGNLQQEGSVFIAYCNSCHAAPHPARHTLNEWMVVLMHMENRMRERSYALPDHKSKQAIIDYLARYARK